MKLLLDAGNTRLKWGLADDHQIRASGALASTQIDAKSLQQQLTPVLSAAAASPGLNEVWVSNVGAEDRVQFVLKWLAEQFSFRAQLIDVASPVPGFHNNYATVATLGVDRWVAAIGARHKIAQGDLIIIDAGTAVTIDWLSAENSFEGGVILPGAGLMHQALLGGTSGIDAEITAVGQIIGKTTSECVNSGIGFGTGGAVERIVKEMTETIKRPARLILTGGGADLIRQVTSLDALFEADLVLYGLYQLSLFDTAKINNTFNETP